jgi:low temperature requirement protein LtrA
VTAVPWRQPLTGRDPAEAHRAATPLELFFDLCFVVAVAAAAAAFHHDLAADHLGSGLLDYLMVFFAIWWAWVNYSWFASAYDTGDVVFRLATFVIMTGVLVLAAAIPAITGAEPDFTLGVVGYAIMRLALVPMWLRVARDHAAARQAAHRYAAGVSLVQVLWIGRLWIDDDTLALVSFGVLALTEMVIPWWAEHGEHGTPWHVGHIAERYQLFTIIVLGEVILATTQAISASLDLHELTGDLMMLVVGALLLVFSLWWLYFERSMLASFREGSGFFFGYAHYFVLAAVAAVGAGLAACVDLVQHEAHGLDHRTAAVFLATAVAVYVLTLGSIHAYADRHLRALLAPAVVSLTALGAALAGTALSDQIGFSVLLLGLVLTGAVAHHQVRTEV